MKIIKLIFCFLCIMTFTNAQVHEPTEELLNKIDSILSKNLEDEGLYGISVSILSPYLDFSYSVGYTEADNEQKMQSDMLFGLACITKSVISALILQLVDEGKIMLNDSICNLLDSIPENINKTIRVEQLLKMRSGLHEYLDFDFIDILHLNPTKTWNYDELLNLTYSEYNPGYFQYGTPAYLLLGKIVEEVTDNSLEYELNTRFFEPIGMNNTFLCPVQSPIGNWATPYDATGSTIKKMNSDSLISYQSAVWSAGGLVSNPNDISKWFYELFNGRFVSDSLLDEMVNFGQDMPYWADAYGMGIAKFNLDGTDFIGHLGGWPGHKMYALYEPLENISISIATNQWTFNESLIGCVSPLYEIIKTENNIQDSYFQIDIDKYSIYPNPTNNSITIKTDNLKNNSLKITTVNGQILYSQELDNTLQQIDLSFLQSGIYYVTVRLKDKSITKKLMKN